MSKSDPKENFFPKPIPKTPQPFLALNCPIIIHNNTFTDECDKKPPEEYGYYLLGGDLVNPILS